MRKKILIILAILVLGGAGLGVLAVSNANSIINQYKPQIEEMASQTLGTKISIGSVSTSFFPETKLNIDELSIGTKGKDGSFSLKGVSLKVDPMPLLQKKIVIQELSLTDPDITIIKDADGMHIPGAHTGGSGQTQATPATEKKSGEAMPISLSLNKLSIQNGRFSFADKTADREISMAQISLHSSVSFDGSIAKLQSLAISGVMQGKTPLQVNAGTLTYDMQNKLTSIPALDLVLANNKLQATDLTVDGSGAITYKITGTDIEAGDFTALLSDMKFAALNYKGRMSVLTEGTLNASAFDAKTLEISAFGGKITTPIKIAFGTPATFSQKLSVSNIQIDKAMEFLSPGVPSKLFGTVLDSHGALSAPLGAGLKEGLSGQIVFSVKDGGLRGINIAAKALKNADKIPLLSGSLYSYVPKEFQATLASEDTEFSSMTGSVSFARGSMILKNIKLLNKIYTIETDGSLGFDSSLDMNATITFNRDFSLALVSAAHDLKKILTPEETLVLPLTIKGTLPGVVVIPNLTKVIELAGRKILTEKATEALGNVLQGKGGKGLGSLFKF